MKKRLKFADEIVKTANLPYEKARLMFNRILANAAVQTGGNNITDNDIEYIVNSLIDEFI